MARFEADVKLVKEAHYGRNMYSGWGTETVYIYIMEDAEGKRYVWKTTGYLEVPEEDRENTSNDFMHVGDAFKIKATEKGESEYNGHAQTDVNRVKVLEVYSRKADEEQAKEDAIMEQIEEQVKAGGEVMRMDYRRYKKHYSDCLTVPGSYIEGTRYDVPTVMVCIPVGRMKASGSRGKRYHTWTVENEAGERASVKAISPDTATRQAHRKWGGNWRRVTLEELEKKAR